MDSPRHLPPSKEPTENLVTKEFILDVVEDNAPEISTGVDTPVAPT